VDFPLLLSLLSGIRAASLRALIAAYYRTGSTCAVPDLHVWGLAGLLEDLSARAQRWSVYALSGLRACVAIVEIGSRVVVLSLSDGR
jgi:hypothetical protein